jgi:hypothetical protein
MGGTEKELAYNCLRLCPPAGNKQQKIKNYKIKNSGWQQNIWSMAYFLFSLL